MSAADIIAIAGVGGGGGLAVILTLIQVSKINVNPWTAIGKAIGKMLTVDIMKDVRSINDAVKDKVDGIETSNREMELRLEQRFSGIERSLLETKLESLAHYKEAANEYRNLRAELKRDIKDVQEADAQRCCQTNEKIMSSLQETRDCSTRRHEENKQRIADFKSEVFEKLDAVEEKLEKQIDYNKRESDFRDDAYHADDVRLTVKRVVRKMQDEGWEPDKAEADEYYYQIIWYEKFCGSHRPGDTEVEFEYENERMLDQAKMYKDWYQNKYLKIGGVRND